MKIPDDVYLSRCRNCHHGRQGVENRDIPNDKLFTHFWTKDAPCKIIGICGCDKVLGECLSFTPRPMFGICQYCEFNNPFHDGYCTFPSGPINKRRVFLGWGGGGYKNDYWGEHALFTCDHYQVCEYWKDIIMREVLGGRSPANFDPDSWEPLDKLEETRAAQQWAQLQAQERAKEVATSMQKTILQSDGSMGQISLFEMGG